MKQSAGGSRDLSAFTARGRQEDIDRLYRLLDRLEDRVGGKRTLGDCTGHMDWPDRGLYIFFAADETRANTDQHRVARVGTHAVCAGSQTSLWNRLRTHRGTLSGQYAGGGNHRGSVFRLHVGEAMIERDGLHEEYPDWGEGSSAGSDLREQEVELERRVSDYIRDLPFLWVAVDDEPGPDSRRAYIEQQTIALLSNSIHEPVDPRAPSWLGQHTQSPEIQQAGLWNIRHVDQSYDPGFLDVLESHVEQTTPP